MVGSVVIETGQVVVVAGEVDEGEGKRSSIGNDNGFFFVPFAEAEVKKRWRTLRDSFMRFHRLQRIFGPKGKKKMWIYYNKMAFLIPHIEPRE